MTETSLQTDLQPLRDEASSVKRCFTDFSFQALALSLTVLAVTFAAAGTVPSAVYAPLPVVGLLMAVCRIGVFKYATANRNYGYELHLSRVRQIELRLSADGQTRWKPAMRRIDWEEAVRAWRVVQPTLFRQVYVTPQAEKRARQLKRWGFGIVNFFRHGLYRPTAKAEQVIQAFRAGKGGREYPWFMPRELVEHVAGSPDLPMTVYYAGSYLEGMLSALVATQYAMLSPILVGLLDKTSHRPIIDSVLVLVGVCAIKLRKNRIERRRVMLEDELLSIHSCAIVWQAVVICHYLAMEDGAGFDHYTERLARRAQEVAAHAFEVPSWLSGEPM